MRNKGKRTPAKAMALAAWFAVEGVMCAYGKAGQPGGDETMYVTMDPYGNPTQASVVKSYSLHGAKEIVDYGDYLEVNNMTDHTVPVIENSQVVFCLPEDSAADRFYFEGKLDPVLVEKQLPWDITVTYRLNGVERTMEELVHQKGLVEITIDAVPDKNTGDYYKNNMTLETVAMVDMEKNLSVEAHGAQVQSMGTMKTVLFMALPGEEQHFQLNIGTDDFEFSGLMFMMVPVTLGQLEDLEELREARDTVKDSADAVSDSLDVLLDSLEGMEEGLRMTVDGLASLEQSRQTISRSKDGIYVDADQALEVLNELSQRGVPFTGYVEEARKALEDGNDDLNELTDLVQDLEIDLDDLGRDLADVKADLRTTESLLEDGGKDLKAWEQQLEKLKNDLERLKSAKKALESRSGRAETYLESLEWLRSVLEDHGDVLGISPEEVERLKEKLDQILGAGLSHIPAEELERLIASASDALRQIQDGDLGGLLPDIGLRQLIEQLRQLAGKGQEEMSGKLDSLIDKIQGQVDALETIVRRVRQGGENLVDVLEDSRDVIDTLRDTGDRTQDIIWQATSMRDTVNKYHHTATSGMDDTKGLIDSAVRGTSAMYQLMMNVESTMKQAGIPLDRGAKGTIAGLSEALNQGIEGLSQTTVIRDAKTTVENLIEDKWDEYTGEKMNLLNADVNAQKVSFTSLKNPEPESLQIILRTEGTGEAEEEPEAETDESFHSQGNFLDRIWNILKEIFRSITSVFR